MRKILIGGVAVLGLMALGACHPVEIHDHHHHEGMTFGADGWTTDSDAGWMSNDKTALKTIAALTCPDTEGDLTLVNKAPDGKSCDYSGRHDDTVHLTLMPLTGTPQATLAPMETELKGLMPPPKSSAVNVESSNDGSAMTMPRSICPSSTSTRTATRRTLRSSAPPFTRTGTTTPPSTPTWA